MKHRNGGKMKQSKWIILYLIPSALFLSSIFTLQFPKVNAVSSSEVWGSISTEITLPSGEYMVSNVVETSDGLFIATDMEIYKSTSGGQTWTLKHNATSGIIALSLYATSKNWLITVFLGSSLPAQRISKDGGETWIDGSPSVMPWITGIAELPNGTILMGRWGAYGGGCVYKSDDGINYSLLWNFTQMFPDYPQNHTHAVGFNPYNNKIYVGLGDVPPKLLYVSPDYGQNWVRYTADGPVGMWFEPDGTAYFGCDWGSDDIFKITPSNEIVKLNLINKYSAIPHLHHIIKRNNVFYAGISSEFDPSPIGIAVSPNGDEWAALKIIDNKLLRSTVIKEGLTDDYLWIVLDEKLYKVRTLEESEVEYLMNSEPTVLAVSGESKFVSFAEAIIDDPKVRVYGVNVTNQVNNPSFETWSEGQPTGWTFQTYPSENWITAIETVTGLFGERAVRVKASSTAETGMFGFNQSVSVEVGKSYTLSTYFKSNITRAFGPYIKINGELIEKASLGKTVYENWTRVECTFDGVNSTSLMIEIGWVMYGGITSQSGILLDIDGVLLQEGTKATPYIDEGTSATKNPKIKFGETWLNYTGTISNGSYQEFSIGQEYLTGTFKIVSIIEGSNVANVTILGTKIATVQNALIMKQNDESFTGIFYGTPTATGNRIITLASSSNYGKITSHSFTNRHHRVTISAALGTTTITKVYIPHQASNQTPFPNDNWEANSTSTNWNKTWDSANRILTISVLHEVGSITIEIYEKPSARPTYGIEIYLAIAIAVGCSIILVWWPHRKKKMKIVHVYRFASAHAYSVVVLIIILAFATLFYSFPMPELNWDAGRLGMSGIFWHDVIRNVVMTGRFTSLQEFVATYLKQYESDFLFYPAFLGLVYGFSFLFFGISEATFYFTMLIFALATIVATYLLASKLYDKRIGVISSLFVGSSHALFGYTKSVATDIPATAMVTISILALLRAQADKRWKYSVLAGVLVGLSFMTKPTTAIIIAPIAISLILQYLRARDKKIGSLIISRRFEKENFRKDLRNFMLILVPASILFLTQIYIWTSSDMLSLWLYASYDPRYPSTWYSYFSWILTEYLSPIVVLLFLIGFAFSILRRNNSDKLLLIWFITFILFASLYSNRTPRYLLTLIPCVSIIAAQGMVSLYNLAKEKLKIRKGISVKNLTTTIVFLTLIIIGTVDGFTLIQRDPYKDFVDFNDIDKSPMNKVANFLVEKNGVLCFLPAYEGWVELELVGGHSSLPTLEFYILKNDRQRTTYFYVSYGSWETMSNETFLELLDQISDYFEGKTVYVVVPYAFSLSWDFLILEFPSLEPYKRFISYIESHSGLVPLVAVFRRGGLEVRVYQRIKGAFGA